MLTPDTWNQIDGPLRVPPPTMTWDDFTALLDALHHLNQRDVVDAGIIVDRMSDWLRFRYRPISSFLGLSDDKKHTLFDLLVVRAAS